MIGFGNSGLTYLLSVLMWAVKIAIFRSYIAEGKSCDTLCGCSYYEEAVAKTCMFKTLKSNRFYPVVNVTRLHLMIFILMPFSNKKTAYDSLVPSNMYSKHAQSSIKWLEQKTASLDSKQ